MSGGEEWNVGKTPSVGYLSSLHHGSITFAVDHSRVGEPHTPTPPSSSSSSSLFALLPASIRTGPLIPLPCSDHRLPLPGHGDSVKCGLRSAQGQNPATGFLISILDDHQLLGFCCNIITPAIARLCKNMLTRHTNR